MADFSTRNVCIVGENERNVRNFGRQLNIDAGHMCSTNRVGFIQTSLTDESIDMLVIDVDSLGIRDASYLIFLANCLTPWRPIVLITNQTLEHSVHQRYLSGGATAVIRLTDSSNTEHPRHTK